MEDTQESGPQLASRWSRLAAAIIDLLLLLILMLPLGYLLAGYDIIELLPKEETFQNRILTELVAQLIFAVAGMGIYCALHWKLLAKSGQTIGKKILKIKVVMADGTPASVQNLAFKRYGLMILISYIPILGTLVTVTDLLMILGSERRALHDRIAKTKVIKA